MSSAFFSLSAKRRAGSDPSSSFAWLPALGPQKSCLHGVNMGPPSHPKLAIFDLDGTVIKWAYTKKGSKSSTPTWEWWNPCVPARLKELSVKQYSVIIVSNQCLSPVQLSQWKLKAASVASALNMPLRLFVATARDGYRKPMPGIWWEIQKILGESAMICDKDNSFFVGDAAGRQQDFAGTDRKWAANAHIKFLTPEEFFLGLPPMPFILQGLQAASLLVDVPQVTPTSFPVVKARYRSNPEIVVLVGLPASGKTTFITQNFPCDTYIRLIFHGLESQDQILGSIKDCLLRGMSCAIDGLYPSSRSRQAFTTIARKLATPVRCFVFNVSVDLAWHNNLYRAYCASDNPDSKTQQKLISRNAFSAFQGQYERPSNFEGFDEIRDVHWVFRGNQTARDRWSMWLQIDGK